MPTTDPKRRPIRWSDDLLRYVWAARHGRQLVPEAGIFDPPYTCVKVNAQWASHVIGALDILNAPDAWLGGESEVWRAQQEIEKLLNAVAVGACGDVPGISDIRVNGCNLEISYDGTSWVIVGDLSACAVPGPAGPPGEDGQDGTDGKSVPAGSYAMQGSTIVDSATNENYCASAELYVTWLMELLADTLDAAQASLGKVSLVGNLLQLPVSWIPGIGNAVGQFVDLAVDIAEDEISGIRSEESSARREQLTREIYCYLQCEEITDLKSSDILGTIRAALVAIYPNEIDARIEAYLTGLFDSIDPDEHYGRLSVYSLDTSVTCALFEDCGCGGEWCYTFDFTQSDGGWIVDPDGPRGVYTPGIGWTHSSLGVRIRFTLPMPATITSMSQKFDFSASRSQSINHGYGPISHLWEDENRECSSGNPAALEGNNVTYSCDSETGTLSNYLFVYNSAENISMTLKRVTIRGTGANPFGENNCD